MRAATSTASASSSSRCSPAASPTAPRTRWRSSTSTARSRSRSCRRSSRSCSRSSSGCWRRRRRIASRRRRRRPRRCSTRSMRGWRAGSRDERRGADRGALGGALCAPRPARAAAARAAVRGALGLRGAPLRAVHRLRAHGRPAGVAEPPRGARLARGAARDNRRPAAAFSLGPPRAGARGLKAAAAPGLQSLTNSRPHSLSGTPWRKYPRAQPAREAKMSERPHLLIVDDDREIRGLLAQYLEKHDFRTTAVADGKEMRRVMERSHVDLLVLDLMLPGEDGLTLCRELRSRSQVPIIMLTARGEDVDRIVGLELGAADYLPKPFDRSIDVRVSRLRQILGDDARAPQIIKTVYGEGYVVGVAVASD